MGIIVEGPNGEIVEFPDGTTPEVMQSAMKKQFSAPEAETAPVEAQAPQEEPKNGLGEKLGSVVQGIGQGATFGFGDEIEAVLASIIPADKLVALDGSADIRFGKLRHNLEQIQERNRKQKEANPKTALASELAGAVLTGGAGVAKLGAVKASAVGGAAYGAGSEDGGLADRAQGAAIGAALGAAGGKAAEVVAPITAKAFRGIASKFANRGKITKADNIIIKEVMRQNGIGKSEAIEKLANLSDETPELLFQKLGLQEFAEGTATSGGATRETFEKAIIEQQRGQQDRISKAVKRIIGAKDFNSLKGEIGEKLSGEGSKLYQEAFSEPFTVSRELAQLSQRPAMKKALAQGAKIAADEGIDVADNPLLTYHYAKMGLDRMIGTSVRKSGGNPQSRAFMKVKEQLLSEMDAVPQYAQARQLWAGQKANESALELGRSVLSKRADDVAQSVQGLSQGEKQHMLAGVIQAIDDKLQTKALSHDAGGAFKAEKVRNVLRELLTEDQATKMLNMIDAESRLTQTGRRVRPSLGSPTAPKQEALKRVQSASAGPVRRTAGTAIEVIPAPVQSIKKAFRLISSKVTKENPAVLEALAVRLSGTPDEAAQIFQRLSPQAQKKTSKLWEQAGGIGPFIAGQAAVRAEQKITEPAIQ